MNSLAISPVIDGLTDCGDLAVLLPLIAVVGLWLLAVRKPAAASWWGIAVGLCIGGTAVLKIYFFVCPPAADLHSPSGHTSLSILVYGALTLAVAAELAGRQRVLTLALGGAFVTAIAISRVLVAAHTFPEVVLGSIIGLGALALFTRRYWPDRPAEPHLRPLIVTSAVLVVLLNGQQLRAEDLLHALGIYLHGAIACV